MDQEEQQKAQAQKPELTPEDEALLAEMERHHAERQGGGEEATEEASAEQVETTADPGEGSAAEMILQPATVEAIGAALNALLIDVLAYIKRP